MAIFDGFSLGDLSNNIKQSLSQAVSGDEDFVDDTADQAGQQNQRSVTDVAGASAAGILNDYNNYTEKPGNRMKLYQQYEQMAEDSIIDRVLKTYSDDAFGIKNESGQDIWARAENDDIEERANDFIRENDIPKQARDMTYTLLLYGDEFWKLRGEEDEGVQNINWNIHPKLYRRFEKDGQLAGFLPDDDIDRDAGHNKKELDPPWSAVHIRSGMGPNTKQENIPQPDSIHEGRYGAGVFESTLADWKKLNLMEDSMVFTRYSKSRRPLLMYVDLSGFNDDDKKEEYYNSVKNRILNNEAFSESGEEFQSGRDLMGSSEPEILPIEDGNGKIDWDDMSESPSSESIIDVKYFRNKVFGSFAVPSAFLGLEDKLPGSVGSENALLPISIQYARTVRRVQAQILAGIERILRIHFAWQGEVLGPQELSIETQSVTTAEDLTRAETASKLIQTFQSLIQLFGRGPLQDVDIDEPQLAKFVIDRLNYPGLSPSDLIKGDIEELASSDDKAKAVNEAYEKISQVHPVTAEDMEADLPDEDTRDSMILIPASKYEDIMENGDDG
jgi:hypothetical protein